MTKYPTPIVTITDPTLDRPAGPPTEDPVDHATMLRYAEQQAERDAGIIDATYVQYQEGRPYPAEDEAEFRLKREVRDARKGLSDAMSIGDTLKQTASVALTVNGKGVQKDFRTTVAIEKKHLKEASKRIKETLASRAKLTDTLEGKAQASDGIVWTGSVPTMPTADTTKNQIRWSAANIRDKAITWVPLIGLGLAEGAIVIGTVKDYMRQDSYLLPIGFGIAFLVGLVGLPGFLGQTLAKVYRRGFAMGKELAVLIGWGLVWLSVVAGTVFFRVSSDRNKAIEAAARAQQVPLDQIDANAVYSIPVHALIWTAAVMVIGAFVIFVKMMFYNPVIGEVIKTDCQLVDLYHSRFLHASILQQGKALIRARIAAAEAVVEQWEHHITETLPARKDEFCAHFRHWLATYTANPGMTNGIYDDRQAA